MRYTVNCECEVNVNDVRLMYEPTESWPYYDDLFIRFDKPLYFITEDNGLLNDNYIQINTDIYDYSLNNKDWKENSAYVDHIIRGLLIGSLKDEEIEDLILTFDNGEPILIKDIKDKKIKEELIKMIRKAMVDYQI